VFSTLAPDVLPLRVPFERALALAAAAGFDALDLPVTHLHERSRTRSAAEIQQLFAAAGVRPGGWMLPFDHQADERTFALGMRRLPAIAKLAGGLGSPWCYYWIEPASDELDYAANTARHVQRLRPLADVLGEHECRLALEPIGPRTLRAGARHEFVYSIPMALELLDAVDRPNVCLLLDCFHWYTARDTLAEVRSLSAAQVGYVHINDAPAGVELDDQLDQVRTLPLATGLIDLEGFLAALEEIGYDGPVAVEPFDRKLARTPPAKRVQLAGDSLRSAFASAGVTSRPPA
jgi:sugar phosphate isomerase/epimerase